MANPKALTALEHHLKFFNTPSRSNQTKLNATLGRGRGAEKKLTLR